MEIILLEKISKLGDPGDLVLLNLVTQGIFLYPRERQLGQMKKIKQSTNKGKLL